MTDIELSIVTGTYNRLPYLQRMVDSVRESVGIGISYEIVLVDGGSKDGTIGWCEAQPDIVLIEQGELLGAIKAFNAGLYATRGRYCVVGNDDVLYIDDTLPVALAFMQDNPDVGVGCFYQDRDHPGQYDVSRMPAVLDGRQVMHVYGQVCIVPKWLGDAVGWWGNFPDLRTYGGDNNLSSSVLEYGYRVTPIPCACISDLKAEDELRKINNDYRLHETRGRGGHPDSIAWGKHWTHKDGTCGPIISRVQKASNTLERKKRFLYAPIYETGHSVQKQQKRGLRDALARKGVVWEYDWQSDMSSNGGAHMLAQFQDMIDSWRPDIVLTQIHSPDKAGFNVASIAKIRAEQKFMWVNWNGDYHPEDLLSQSNVAMARLFDLQCVVTTEVNARYSEAGVPWMYWQIGYEPSGAEPGEADPSCDVAFLANGYSANRLRLGKTLMSLASEMRIGIYGSWGPSTGVRPAGMNLYNFDAGRKVYRNSKLAIGDDQWKASGFVSNRLFQAMAAGRTMLLHQRVPDLDKLLGLQDGIHYVVWDNIDDLTKKIHYWLDPKRDEKRRSIADAGTAFILENHSFDARVDELLSVL